MGVSPDHHQLDSVGVSGWTVGPGKANVTWIVGTATSKPRAVYAVSLVDQVHGVDFVVQVPCCVQGVPAAGWDVCSRLHTGVGCAAERAGKEAGGR